MSIGRFFRNATKVVINVVKNKAYHPAAYTRLIVRRLYDEHLQLELSGKLPVKDRLTPHQCALFGALWSKYKRYSPVIQWDLSDTYIAIEVMPFQYLPRSEGIEALGEYIAWKESPHFGNFYKVRLDWLGAKVREGVSKAQKNLAFDFVRDARNLEPPVKWVEFLEEGTDRPWATNGV